MLGVVEFTPELPTVNWQLRTVLHFENYTRIIREAAEHDVDILIFPEYTLNNVAFPVEIPDPLDEINPCLEPDLFDRLLIDLSCLARENEIYLCINLNEREDCTEESQQERNDKHVLHLASRVITQTSYLIEMEQLWEDTGSLIYFEKAELIQL